MFLDEKVICPSCGVERSLRSFALSGDTLEIAKLAGRFGSNWPWVLEYIHSFQTAHDKPLKPGPMKSLLTEILGFIEKKGFYFDRKWQSVRPDALFAAIRQVALLNKLSFRNHHYLFRVALDFNLKMIQREEGEVQKKEHDLMERSQRDPRGTEKIKEIINKL